VTLQRRLAVFGEGAQQPLYEVIGGVLQGNIVAIGEQSTGLIHLFDTIGTPQGIVGGLGEGPGQFQRIEWIQTQADQICAYDGLLRRLSCFSSDGQLITSARIGPPQKAGMPYALGVFPNGSILVENRPRPQRPNRAHAVRPVHGLSLYSPQGEFRVSVGYYRATELWVEPRDRNGRLIARLVFGRQSRVVVQGDAFFVADNEQPTVREYRADGTVRATHRISAVDPARLRRADIDVVRQSFATRSADTTMLELLDRMETPDMGPYFGWEGPQRPPFLVPTRNGFCVLRHGIPGDRTKWSCYDERAETLRVIDGPDVFGILDVSDDLALVLRRDQWDVETVELWRLGTGR